MAVPDGLCAGAIKRIVKGHPAIADASPGVNRSGVQSVMADFGGHADWPGSHALPRRLRRPDLRHSAWVCG